MRDVADKEGLRYHDRSEDAEAELRSLEAMEDSFPLILISGGNGEYGFGANNVGLPSDQVVIGFRAPETTAALAFAGKTVDSLKMYWDVAEVPDDRGALPIKCR